MLTSDFQTPVHAHIHIHMCTHEHIHTNPKIVLASKNFSINGHVTYVLTKHKSTYKLKTFLLKVGGNQAPPQRAAESL